jgi:hypothetical protein
VPGASRADIFWDGTLEDSLLASTHAPSVTILSPTPGEVLGPTSELVWEWGDADGDAPVADVGFRDRADTMVTLADHVVTTTIGALPVADLPSTNVGELVVTVSDGFHSTTAQVGGLKVLGNRPPTASILPPDTGQCVRQTSGVVLEGVAFDPEDREVPASNMLWSSDLVGPLGVGPIVFADLPAGTHTLTFQVTDGDGATAFDMTVVEVY